MNLAGAGGRRLIGALGVTPMTDKPHDALFRHAFSRVEHAASALRAVLAPEVAARIDFESLALEEGSFISQKLAGQSCDLLFSAKRVGGDGMLRGGSAPTVAHRAGDGSQSRYPGGRQGKAP